MLQKITIKELREAMRTTVTVASNADTKTFKSLKFHLIDLSYHVVYQNEAKVVMSEFKHPQDAIDMYNKF